MITNQACLFFAFIVNGITIGILFDLFRVLRISFKTKDIITYLEDILFWILTGAIILYSIFVFNKGVIRLYIFIGIALGVTLYITIFSNSVVKTSVLIISYIKRFILKLISILSIPISFVSRMIKNIIIKFLNIIKKKT